VEVVCVIDRSHRDIQSRFHSDQSLATITGKNKTATITHSAALLR
jgi:hypothetical protein